MTGEERYALLLAARLLESDAPVADVAPDGAGGHVDVGVALAQCLRGVTEDSDATRQIIASLRSAAREPASA